MQLVILAAGHGRRFGGLKQLVPVGPRGEAIMDYTVYGAERVGYDQIVVVVRHDIYADVMTHIRRRWPPALEVRVVCQSETPGTASAVLAAQDAVDAPFVVANADDLYEDDALYCAGELLNRTAASRDGERYGLVSFELAKTIVSRQPVTRGLCQVSSDNELLAIIEHTLVARTSRTFEARPLNARRESGADDGCGRIVSGAQWTSMNLWSLHRGIFRHLRDRIDSCHGVSSMSPELLLPSILGDLVARAVVAVDVAPTTSRCIGVTHQEDLAIVKEAIALAYVAQP